MIIKGLGNGLLQIRGIVVIRQGVDLCLEVFPGLELLVKGHAGTVQMEKGKPLMTDAFNQSAGDRFSVSRKESGHKGGAV